MTRLRSALWPPILDDLAEPAVVARLAAEAAEAGWHGVNKHVEIGIERMR